jgi:predicted deacylase
LANETSVLHDIGMPTGDSVSIVRRRFCAGDGPHVAIVAGIRGDTPEGVRVAWRVADLLEEHHEALTGTVDIYPCVNPLAAHRGQRHWPFFDQDLNRRFPGRSDGHAPDVVAWKLTEAVRAADLVVELRGAHPAFRETAQAHVERAEAADLARHANVDLVWTRGPGPASGSTFAGQFPGAIRLEGGSGNRLTPGVGKALADGVLNLLNVIGILPDEALTFHWAAVSRPVLTNDEQVHRVRSGRAGLFLPSTDPWDEVAAGQALGEVVDATTGKRIEEVVSPVDGRVVAVREQPVVFPGTLVCRVVEVSGD